MCAVQVSGSLLFGVCRTNDNHQCQKLPADPCAAAERRRAEFCYVQIPLDGDGPNQTEPDQTRPDTVFASRVSDQVSDMFGSG